jgi:hypothetical protein
MRVPRLRLAMLAMVSGVALSGCAYDMYGDPYGYGYGPSSSVSIGVGYGGGWGGYYGDYGYGYPYGGYGYGYGGYGYDPFGWYGDYYYPGSGIYVYDRYRTRHVWNDDQRRYWEQRRQRWGSQHNGTSWSGTNWSGWDRTRWRNNNTGATSTVTTRSSTPYNSYRQERAVRTDRVRSWSGDRSSPRQNRERADERPD